jgi:DNA-binding transcriptional LysR family regulator
VRLSHLDLNLLIPLDALLRERSVTRAAASLGLSQPALSASLARLRRHFGDELLTRVGNSYELTPLAVALRRRVGVALTGAERVFASEPGFDPSTSRRDFTLLGSDYPMVVLGASVARILAERAPGVRLRFQHQPPAVIESAGEALREVDGLVFPHGFLSDTPHQDLYGDTWVCLVATDNHRVGDALTMDDLATLPWVLTYNSSTAFTPADRQLQILGVQPNVQVVVESFVALPYFIAGTDRIGLVQGHLAGHLVRNGDVRALPCPYDVVPLTEALWWHPMHDRDPEHMWLRSVLVEAGASVGSGSDTVPGQGHARSGCTRR